MTTPMMLTAAPAYMAITAFLTERGTGGSGGAGIGAPAGYCGSGSVGWCMVGSPFRGC
jgi:hypothetical protein